MRERKESKTLSDKSSFYDVREKWKDQKMKAKNCKRERILIYQYRFNSGFGVNHAQRGLGLDRLSSVEPNPPIPMHV